MLLPYLFFEFFLFEICYKSTFQSDIARFDPDEDSWARIGYLHGTRAGHGVIQVGNEFIVVGGSRDGDEDIPTESCKLNGQFQITWKILCTPRLGPREQKLRRFTYYPELILIP